MKFHPHQLQAAADLAAAGDRALLAFPIGAGGRETVALTLHNTKASEVLVVAPNMLHQTWRHVLHLVADGVTCSLLTPEQVLKHTLDYKHFDTVVVEFAKWLPQTELILDVIHASAKRMYLRVVTPLTPEQIKIVLKYGTTTVSCEVADAV